MSEEPRFHQNKEKLRDSHVEVTTLQLECRKMKEKLEEAREMRRLDVVLDRLRISASEKEEESEVSLFFLVFFWQGFA